MAPVEAPTYLAGASETTVPEILDSDGPHGQHFPEDAPVSVTKDSHFTTEGPRKKACIPQGLPGGSDGERIRLQRRRPKILSG